jgi:ATP-binding cassette subfamily B protein
MKLSYPRFYRMQIALDKLNTAIREYLTGLRLVKAFRRFETEEKRFALANDYLTERSLSAGRIMAVFSPCMQLFAGLGITAIVFFGSRWVSAGVMEVGSVMAFVIYMQQITQSFNMISMMLNQVVRVKASGERVFAVLHTETPNVRADTIRPYGDDKDAPAVSFNDVRFNYKGSTGQPALDGLLFSVKKGQTLGIIGATGAGKSSLAALLLRYYAPSAGEIAVFGVPLGAIPEKELRQKIAVVPQTAMLFTGPIKDNIRWGKPEASDEEVWRAAELACAHDFIIAQHDGYETVIGKRGLNLSGGQKQRLSLARALLHEPDILILDDCTSALDAITEAKVRENLKSGTKEMTCLMITQRIGTVMDCDLVLVLENGKAAGLGTHAELMQNCELYRDIYRSQIGLYEKQVV